MGSGIYEIGENGRRCFRPAVPTMPRLEDVHDLLDVASRNVVEFDRLLADRAKGGAVGRLFARLDAVHSSGAEGSTTTFTDLMEYETSARTAPDPEDAASVAAVGTAFETEASSGASDMTEMTLRIHRRLFEQSRNKMISSMAGRWKARVNGTSDEGSPGGYFYFTRPESVIAAMKDWHDFTLASDARVPELVRQIVSHWMFEHIHPVADGNGRIGRLLVPLVLKTKGTTSTACVFLGEAVHEDKQLYLEALRAARESGDWTSWTRLMLSFVSETTSRNIERIGSLAEIEKDWRSAIKEFRSDSVVHKLVSFALTNPVFTVNDAVRGIGGTFVSVNTAVANLVKAEILKTPPAGTKRDRIFEADRVLALFDRFRAQPEPPSSQP